MKKEIDIYKGRYFGVETRLTMTVDDYAACKIYAAKTAYYIFKNYAFMSKSFALGITTTAHVDSIANSTCVGIALEMFKIGEQYGDEQFVNFSRALLKTLRS